MIRIERLSFGVGDFQLRQLSLEVAQGQYFVLLGPPGSGKTIFMECLCGLRKVESGRIYIDKGEVTDLEPRARGIGYVPQDHALFPHLSVERNIAFGYRVRGYRGEDVIARVAEIVDLLGMRHLLSRRINGLSGGERQQAALARALVLRPKVLLLDEPVCALDEASRQEICSELQRLQHQLGLTTIHVSHNIEEAFSVADKAGILGEGKLQQIGSIDELLRKPRNEFVARFMRCENIFSGEAVSAGPLPKSTTVQCAQTQLVVAGRHHGQIKFMLRPEDVLVLAGDRHSDAVENKLRVNLIRARDCGNYVKMELKGAIDLVAHLSHAAFTELKARGGSNLVAVIRRENIHIFPA